MFNFALRKNRANICEFGAKKEKQWAEKNVIQRIVLFDQCSIPEE